MHFSDFGKFDFDFKRFKQVCGFALLNVVKNKFLINLHPFGSRLQPTLVDYRKFAFLLQATQAGMYMVFNTKNFVKK